MGRTEQSQGLAPPAIRKDMRAKQARYVVNKVVPALLASNARAKRGVDGSELVANPGPNVGGTAAAETGNRDSKIKSKNKSKDVGVEDSGYVKRKGQGRRKAKGNEAFDEEGSDGEREGKGRGGKAAKGKKRNDSLDAGMSNLNLTTTTTTPPSPKKEKSIRIITTDTLTAAHMLSQHASAKPGNKKQQQNTCILNMASPLRPGGGVYTGATSQEEFLCARTTLLPSLKEEYYRLPEQGGIFTHDILVFRNSLSLADSAGELSPADRWYVDVISAGMLRFPELEGEDEGEEKRLGKKDREIVEGKIRAVLRIAEQKGVKKLVLGAWGCGAYGNPVRDVAEAFRRVLDGTPSTGNTRKNKGVVSAAMETWPGIEDVVFAIANRKMARDFAKAFGGGVEVEDGPGDVRDEEEEEEEDKAAEELRGKIQEVEGQMSKVWNADLKARLGVVLEGLKAQLREREGTPGASGDEEEDEDENDEEKEESEEEGDDVPIDALDSNDEDEDAFSDDSDAQQPKTKSHA